MFGVERGLFAEVVRIEVPVKRLAGIARVDLRVGEHRFKMLEDAGLRPEIGLGAGSHLFLPDFMLGHRRGERQQARGCYGPRFRRQRRHGCIHRVPPFE